MKIHIKNVQEDKRNYKCGICKDIFPSKLNLHTHKNVVMWQINNKEGENQDSGSCGKSFNHSWNT